MTGWLILAGWSASSLLAVRLLLRAWWSEFGDYQDVLGPMFFIALIGPIGVIVALVIGYEAKERDEPRDHKVLDALRGKATR